MLNNPSQTLTDLETIWSALDSFYERFTPKDWGRKHGKEWTFADMPFHLAYFNQTVINGIRNDHGKKPPLTLQELNTWNNAHFAERLASQSGAKALGHLHETEATLRQVAAEHTPETPVFMPLIIVGGWRTLTFALNYLLNHTWIHFTESHLRFTGRLPALPIGLVNRTLNFTVVGAGGALRPEDLVGVNLVAVLRLTGDGGGVWTFTMRDGKCQVTGAPAEQADTEITTDIATYLKTSLYNMQSPIVALLTGKTRIKGMAGGQQFQKIFAVTPSRIWNFVEDGKVTQD
jgi:DinB superfamily/SCP-2 sterol transfer family